MRFWRTLGLGKYYIPCDIDHASDAFLEAFDFLPKNPGGHVYAPAAEYTMNAALDPAKNNVTLEGAGIATVLKNVATSDHNIFDVTGDNHFTILNLKLDGNKANNPSDDRRGINISSASDILIENVEIVDTSYQAIYGLDCSRVNIIRCKITDPDFNGIRITGTCADNLIDGCYLSGAIIVGGDGHNIHLGGQDGTRVVNCRSIGAEDTGIMLTSSNDCLIANNVVHSTKVAIWLGGSANPSPDCRVIGNTVKSTNDAGIGMNSSPRCNVADNIAYECGWEGIQLANCDDCTVSGNICYDNGQSATANRQDGIQITEVSGAGSTGVVLLGNRCFDSGGGDQEYGIAIRGTSDDCTLVGNNVEGNNTDGYFITAAATNCPIKDGHLEVLAAPGELTIDTNGVITVTRKYHTVDTFEDAATDDLDTISGGRDGMVIILTPENSGRDVTIKDMTGNIAMDGSADFTMLTRGDKFMAIYDARFSLWIELQRIIT